MAESSIRTWLAWWRTTSRGGLSSGWSTLIRYWPVLAFLYSFVHHAVNALLLAFLYLLLASLYLLVDQIFEL
jgi:hypothetical protein